MRKKRDSMKFILAIASIAFVSIVRADEAPHLVPVQTALNSTVISGYVQSGSFEPLSNALSTSRSLLSGMENRNFDRHLRPTEFSRPQGTDGAPPTALLPSSLGIDNTAVFESSLTLTPANSPTVSLSINPTFSSDGSSMVETILAGEELSPPATQEFQADPIILDFQAGIEPVPEPSTFAFVGITLGLVVLARVNAVSMLSIRIGKRQKQS